MNRLVWIGAIFLFLMGEYVGAVPFGVSDPRSLAMGGTGVASAEASNAVFHNPALLAQFPEGYRYLAYLQSKIGYKVKRDMPGLDGPDLDALYAKGEAWLKGKKL